MSPSDRDRHLLEQPQPLGILPTWWFWNNRENWRLVRWPFAILVFALLTILAVLSLPLAVELAALVGVFCLSLGGLEKYVRLRALERRALAEGDSEPKQVAD